MLVAVFLCVSGQDKDGKVIMTLEDSTLYKSMMENNNYELKGLTYITLV